MCIPLTGRNACPLRRPAHGDRQALRDHRRLSPGIFRRISAWRTRNLSERWLQQRNRDLELARTQTEAYNRSITDRAACGIVCYTLPSRADLYMNEVALQTYLGSGIWRRPGGIWMP